MSGPTIASLATIMVCVFLSFVISTDLTIKLIGLGMASAIAVDAIFVRAVLVPAIMHTTGTANWRLPSWLNRHLPHLDIEGDAVASPVEKEAPAKDEVPVPA